MVVDEPVVVSDHIITSQGMGTAVLLGLELVKQLVGSDCAEQIKKAIHF
jgi:transcriptional regulator GlxA family with amidase domain